MKLFLSGLCSAVPDTVNLVFTKNFIINNYDKHLLKKINNITLQQFVNDEHYGTLLLIIIIFLLF